MDAGEIVTRMFNALVAGDDATYFALVTDDFVFDGPFPEPLSAEGWFALTRLFKLAFPDLDFDFRVTEVDGSQVRTHSQISGTHLGELDLTPLGSKVFPPTRKHFRLPPESGLAQVVDGRVAHYEAHHPGGRRRPWRDGPAWY